MERALSVPEANDACSVCSDPDPAAALSASKRSPLSECASPDAAGACAAHGTPLLGSTLDADVDAAIPAKQPVQLQRALQLTVDTASGADSDMSLRCARAILEATSKSVEGSIHVPESTAESSAESSASACDKMLAEYVAGAPAGFVEPLLRPDRLHFGAVSPERAPIEVVYHKCRDSFWTEAEVDLADDARAWHSGKLKPEEREFILRVLAFFSQSDGLVADNCKVNFATEIEWREFRHVFNNQAFMEDIHARTYSLLLNTFERNDARRQDLEEAIKTIPTIAAKAAWMQKYMNRDLPLAARLVAFLVAEGVFFSGSFCAIYWLKKRNLLHGLTFSNEQISKDEALHCETTVLAYSYIQRRLPVEYVHALFADAVRVEQAFVTDALPVRLIGMNADLMCAYIQFVADFWLVALGYPKLFGTANPFDWMDLLSLNGRTNFFERRVPEYSLATTKFVDSNNTDAPERGSASVEFAALCDADF